MYHIIGADGKQYGPVATAILRQWVNEGRANAQTLVKLDGAADWCPLSSVTELSDIFGAAPTGAPPILGSRPPVAANRANNKLAAGLCGILLGGWGVHKFILGYSNAGGIMLGLSLASLIGGFITCGILLPGVFILHIIGLIEGIIYLTKSDEEFVRTYVDNRKEWF